MIDLFLGSRATLPNFHLPAAVEVLTTGSYSRVPRCIRDRIVPPDPITASEKRQVLLRLNQVIEHRLVSAGTSVGPLPMAMQNLRIENGRVTFTGTVTLSCYHCASFKKSPLVLRCTLFCLGKNKLTRKSFARGVVRVNGGTWRPSSIQYPLKYW